MHGLVDVDGELGRVADGALGGDGPAAVVPRDRADGREAGLVDGVVAVGEGHVRRDLGVVAELAGHDELGLARDASSRVVFDALLHAAHGSAGRFFICLLAHCVGAAARAPEWCARRGLFGLFHGCPDTNGFAGTGAALIERWKLSSSIDTPVS